MFGRTANDFLGLGGQRVIAATEILVQLTVEGRLRIVPRRLHRILNLDEQFRQRVRPLLLRRFSFADVSQIAQQMGVAQAVLALPVAFVRRPTVSDQRAFELIENADGVERRLTAFAVRSQMRQRVGAGDMNPGVRAVDPDTGFICADDL